MEILMVRPYQFYFNQQTAANNFFQSNINIENANELAIAELIIGFLPMLAEPFVYIPCMQKIEELKENQRC